MLLKKNSLLATYFWLTAYLFIFLLSFPFINRLNSLFYLFLILYWFIFVVLVYYVLQISKELDFTKLILLVSFLIGLILNLTSQISLSDDLYRYFFDGFLAIHGLNPYLVAPDNPSSSAITSLFPFLNKINNPTVTSPYPPLMILISFIFVLIFGYNILMWLLLTNLVIIITGFILSRTFRMLNLNPNYIILFFNPLVLLTFNHSGHNDAMALLSVVCSIFLLAKAETIEAKTTKNLFLIVAGCFLALGIGIKLFPIFFVPFLLKKLKIGILFTGILTIFQALIYLVLINIRSTGLVIFLENWRGNGGLFELVYYIFNNFDSYTYNRTLQMEIRFIFTSLFIVIFSLLILSYYMTRESNENNKRGFIHLFHFIGLSFIVLFILSPVLHPWYVLWSIIPFIISVDKRFYPYWVLLFFNSFTYYYYLDSVFIPFFILVEYIVFYSSLFFYFRKNLVKVLIKRVNYISMRISKGEYV